MDVVDQQEEGELFEISAYVCTVCTYFQKIQKFVINCPISRSVMDGNRTKKRNRLTQQKVKLMTTMQMNIQQERKQQAIQKAESENRRALRLNARLSQEQSDEAEILE